MLFIRKWNCLALLAGAFAAFTHLSFTAEETSNDVNGGLRRLSQEISSDPLRPKYHFVPPANWMNDPNGLIHFEGKYHLFYQHNPYAAHWDTMHWGHAVSEDLVNWKHLPIALYPDQENADKNGCWSGCAVLNNGVPTLIYTGIPRPQKEGDPILPQTQCMATPLDKNLFYWKKFEGNPLIGSYPEGLKITGFRDPYVWKENNKWYMTVSGGIVGEGGAVFLYESPDLRDWKYIHPLIVGDKDKNGENWECVNFLPLGDKHLLIVSTLGRAIYMLGEYENQKFISEVEGELDLGGSLYAPLAFKDQNDRIILFGWLTENRSGEEQDKARWSGVQSLPRELFIAADGTLGQRPVEEISQLRSSSSQLPPVWVSPTTPFELSRWDSEELNLELSWEWLTGQKVGFKILQSPDKNEETLLYYDTDTKKLVIDRSQSSLNPNVNKDKKEMPLELKPYQPLKLRIFLDGSVVEVFANDRFAMASRIYPTSNEANGIEFFTNKGTASLSRIDLHGLSMKQ